MGTIFSSPIEAKIGIFGHNGAGKTTILYALKGDKNAEIIPTPGFNVEKFNKFGINFTAWDISGRDHRPELRRGFYPGMQAIIFIIDSSDGEELEPALAEFEIMIHASDLQDSVFLVLANKQDLPNAITVNDIRARISTIDIKQKCQVAAVSVKTDQSALESSFKWLAEQLKINK